MMPVRPESQESETRRDEPLPYFVSALPTLFFHGNNSSCEAASAIDIVIDLEERDHPFGLLSHFSMAALHQI